MAAPVSTHQRGFTLIEMSIVLVIIGLIIGGILKGQELIESSRQKNLISQLDQLKSSTTTFTDRFRTLPGDLSRVQLLPGQGPLTTRGNDNGVIGTQTAGAITDLTTTAASALVTAENVHYFNHLLAAGLSGNGALNDATTLTCFSGQCTTASPLPSSAFPSSGLTLLYGSHPGGTNGGGATANPKLANWFTVSRFTIGALAAGQGVVSGTRAFQIDNKYDDGGAGTGNIRSTFLGAGCGTASADYVPNSTVVECSLMFTLD